MCHFSPPPGIDANLKNQSVSSPELSYTGTSTLASDTPPGLDGHGSAIGSRPGGAPTGPTGEHGLQRGQNNRAPLGRTVGHQRAAT